MPLRKGVQKNKGSRKWRNRKKYDYGANHTLATLEQTNYANR